MDGCEFSRLVQLLEGTLDLDSQLAVLEHLDECRTCKEAIYRLSRERDNGYFLRVPYDVDKVLAGRT